MEQKRINIAIDGPAGAGKSTIAKKLSEILKVIYLDTGAMYRGIAYHVLSLNIDVKDEQAIMPILQKLDMDILFQDVQQIIINGKNVTPFIREHSISKASSDISALKSVRLKMVEIQRKVAKEHDVILDGRDIGTFVLPEAPYKFFITASPEERAKRRFLELCKKGNNIEYNKVLKDIKQRDYNDSHRAYAPLKKAEDAICIDTTNLSIEEVIESVLSYIR